MLTTRLFLIGLLCPGLLILGEFWPFFTPIGIVYGVSIAALVWLDRQSAGTLRQFRVSREHDQKLSLGIPNRIVIHLESRSARDVHITVRDETPIDFVGAEDATRSVIIQPREATSLEYSVRPLHRGDYTFGDLNLRWFGPLGFYARQAVVKASTPVKVYPNLHEIQKYDLLTRRDQLAGMGLHNIRLRGEGTAFESLRDYTPDDPYRIINWKATARRGKPISTDYEPERSQRIIIMLDVGRMMRSPIRVDDPGGVTWNMAKVDFVLNSVLLFAYVATLKSDQVGLVVFADQVRQFIAPGAGRSHFQKLLEAMYALQSQPVEANYERALTFLSVHHKKRALVVLFTDLSGSRASEALLHHMPRLSPRHLPMLVTIRDPALDQESGQRLADSNSVYRRAVAEQLIDERRLLLEHLSLRGVLTLDVAAEGLTMAVVNRYLQLKAKMVL